MSTALAVAAVALVVAIVQGVAGFGFALLAVPVFAMVVPVHEAVVLSTLIGSANSGYQSLLLRRDIDWVRTRRYLLGSAAGAPLGLLLYVAAPDVVLRAVVGVAVLLGTMVLLGRGAPGAPRPRLDRSMAVVSGVLLTSTSTNGPPLVLALRSQGVSPEAFRATLAVVFAVTGTGAAAAFALSGAVDAGTLVLVALALPAVWVGARAGHAVRGRVGADAFARLVTGLLVAGAASSIAPLILASVG